jgi:hypothetical protein
LTPPTTTSKHKAALGVHRDDQRPANTDRRKRIWGDCNRALRRRPRPTGASATSPLRSWASRGVGNECDRPRRRAFRAKQDRHHGWREARLGARAGVCRQRLVLALLVNSRHVPGLAAFRCRRGSETCARSDRCSRPYRSSAPFRCAVSVQGRWRLARSAGMPASVQESVNLHAPDCRTIDRLLESDTDQAESHVRERGSSDVRCSIGFLDRRTWRRVLVGVRVPWPLPWRRGRRSHRCFCWCAGLRPAVRGA